MSLESIAWFACVGSLSRFSSGVGVQDTLRIHMGIPYLISPTFQRVSNMFHSFGSWKR